jgi:hypothetical protein
MRYAEAEFAVPLASSSVIARKPRALSCHIKPVPRAKRTPSLATRSASSTTAVTFGAIRSSKRVASALRTSKPRANCGELAFVIASPTLVRPGQPSETKARYRDGYVDFAKRRTRGRDDIAMLPALSPEETTAKRRLTPAPCRCFGAATGWMFACTMLVISACSTRRESNTPLTAEGFVTMPLEPARDAGADTAARTPQPMVSVQGELLFRLRGSVLIPSSRSCKLFDHVGLRAGTLTIPNGTGAATASFPKPGEAANLSSFSGTATTSATEANIALTTSHVETDRGCRWDIRESISGDAMSASLDYNYAEELLDRTPTCQAMASPCTASGTIETHGIPRAR